MYSNIISSFRSVKGVMNMYVTMKRLINFAVMLPTCLRIQTGRVVHDKANYGSNYDSPNIS